MNKIIFILATFILTSQMVNAQKESFDIVSYMPPQDWNIDSKDDYVSYSRIDGASWSQIAVYKSRQSSGSIEDDAQKDWEDIVLKVHTVEQEDKTEPESAEGWQVISRSGIWQYNGANVATLLTTYSNGKQYVSVLWNGTAQPYMKNLKDFIASLDLDAGNAPTQQSNAGNNEQNNNPLTTQNNNTTNATSSSIVGLWTYYTAESKGSNGVFSPGYFRREYAFYEDGTYLFRIKNWSVYVKEIQFVYETGKWKISGNKLTIIPTQSKAQNWSKAASGSSKEWGKLVKNGSWKLERVTYTFNLNYSSLMKETDLVLHCNTETLREGNHENNTTTYSPRSLNQSNIDNPPGFKL